jgi:uncharacterized coiled-coil protein SlyX
LASAINIRIVSIDKSQSTPPAGGGGAGSAIGTFALVLQPSAPNEWQQMFDTAWQQHFYMQKRRAVCTGRLIAVECAPAELEDGLLDELSKVVAETNTVYAKHVEHVTQSRAREEANKAAARADLDAIADRLNAKLGRK